MGISLERMAEPQRLKEDHRRAKAIATGLAGVKRLKVSTDATESNMVLVGTDGIPAKELQDKLKERGTLVLAIKPHTILVALHYQVDDDGVKKCLYDFAGAMEELCGKPGGDF